MNNKLVNFRGNSDGIIISIKKGEMSGIITEIENKLNESRDFFRGAKVKEISGEELDFDSLKSIEDILVNEYGMVVLDSSEVEIKKNRRKSRAEKSKKIEKGSFVENMLKANSKEGKTKFIEATVRSGQLIEYSGNIVVLGDVNPGGVLSASGNIIVLGALKGIARAGSNGDVEALVAAFSLEPTQLQIADVISRKPDEEVDKPEWPEIAKIQDGMIVIESYLKRNSRK